MESFVGLDVSLKETSVCVLNQDGTRVFEGKVASEPNAIARLIGKRAANVVRVGLESGPTSVWITHALMAEGLPVVCLDARHAQAVLSVGFGMGSSKVPMHSFEPLNRRMGQSADLTRPGCAKRIYRHGWRWRKIGSA